LSRNFSRDCVVVQSCAELDLMDWAKLDIVDHFVCGEFLADVVVGG
jgi:hypothetical protein